MTSDDPAPEGPRSARWLSTLRRAIDNLIKVNQNLERLRQDNRELRKQILELAKVVSYQAGQIQQIDQRIKDAVTAEILREQARQSGAKTARAGRRQTDDDED